MLFESVGLNNLHLPAEYIINKAEHLNILTFKGEMGMGKTTLIKSICAALQVVDEVSSPSFSLVNEYKSATGKKIFHFDFYRIKSIEEVYDIGYEDYFFSDSICLIEWPEKIEDLLLGLHYLEVNISPCNNETRNILVNEING